MKPKTGWSGQSWASQSPYNRFFDFIAPNADRYAILLEHIESLGLNSAVIPIAGNRHIFIFPPGQKSLRSRGGVFPFKGQNPIMMSAHYDRVPGSPGANDNSIAVFHLLSAAMTLAGRGGRGKPSGEERWMIVFTDKEELSPGESFEAQGSFTLAKKLKTWGLECLRIFNFDACGAGNTFIISTTTDCILKESDRAGIKEVRKNVVRLRDYALETANLLRLEKVLLAPTPFSDDVGFLRAGLAAQTVTMLPDKEAEHYESLLRSRPDFADFIISGKINEPAERRGLPETWRSMNNASDNVSRLTPQHFENIVRFMVELCRKEKQG